MRTEGRLRAVQVGELEDFQGFHKALGGLSVIDIR